MLPIGVLVFAGGERKEAVKEAITLMVFIFMGFVVFSTGFMMSIALRMFGKIRLRS